MKKYITLVVATILVVGAYVLYSTSLEAKLNRISLENDPASLKLETGYNDYVKRTFLSDHTEIGIIYMGNGSQAKYWFRSHHLTQDIGGALFKFSNGRKSFMAGYFCCELQLPEKQLASIEDLDVFIKKHDGEYP